MAGYLIKAKDTETWRAVLDHFSCADVCQTPEYHVTYARRIEGSEPLMWCYEEGGNYFAYPFLLTPVVIEGKDTGYKDISSIYGYSGPLSSTEDQNFLKKAWVTFDDWADTQNIIAEFIRFSLYADNTVFAHPQAQVEFNRHSAISHLPQNREELFSALGKKTRNMIRKAEKWDLTARELDVEDGLPAFRKLYDETMSRNEATDFFLYDDQYYQNLLKLPPGELRLFGAFHEDKMVSAAMALIYKQGALYHLGAGLQDYASLGAGNLALFEMSAGLLETGASFLTVGGGRTTAPDDPLFRFKKSNAIETSEYFIGKRVVNLKTYEEVVKSWQDLYNTEVSSEKLIFYR